MKNLTDMTDLSDLQVFIVNIYIEFGLILYEHSNYDLTIKFSIFALFIILSKISFISS